MEPNKRVELPYHSEREKYVPHDVNQANDVFKNIKKLRFLLFYAPIVHIGSTVVLFILLLLDLVIENKLNLELTSTEKGLAFAYVGLTFLFDFLFFILPSKKVKKKNHFRILIISTLIIGTLIFSGSLFFWVKVPLLFYALITLIIWILETYAAFLLVRIVESLPN